MEEKKFTEAQRAKLKELMNTVRQAEGLWNSFVSYLANEYGVTLDKWELTMEGFKLREVQNAPKK